MITDFCLQSRYNKNYDVSQQQMKARHVWSCINLYFHQHNRVLETVNYLWSDIHVWEFKIKYLHRSKTWLGLTVLKSSLFICEKQANISAMSYFLEVMLIKIVSNHSSPRDKPQIAIWKYRFSKSHLLKFYSLSSRSRVGLTYLEFVAWWVFWCL